MSLLDNFFKKDTTGNRTLNDDRKKVKKRFIKQLQEQLFMTDKETGAIVSLIEDYEAKIDKIKANYDFEKNSKEEWMLCVNEMYKIEEEMKNDVEEMIRYIMKKKLEVAKKNIGK